MKKRLAFSVRVWNATGCVWDIEAKFAHEYDARRFAEGLHQSTPVPSFVGVFQGNRLHHTFGRRWRHPTTHQQLIALKVEAARVGKVAAVRTLVDPKLLG